MVIALKYQKQKNLNKKNRIKINIKDQENQIAILIMRFRLLRELEKFPKISTLISKRGLK